MKKVGVFLWRGLLVVLVIVLIAGIAGAFYFNRYLPNTVAPKSLPQTEGQIQIEGLQSPVNIYRDKMGIPNIYASNQHDLFFAQGYVHAQDRFWQMDAWRHIGSGTLSEMFGKGQVDTDTFLRTLGWKQVAEQEYAQLDPEAKAIIDSYTEGVNAYLKDHDKTALSLEYADPRPAQPGLQSPAVDAGQQSDLGQGHGLGPARQHGRGDRARHPAQNPDPGAGQRALSGVSPGSSNHCQ